MDSKRTIYRAPAGHPGRCRCGLRSAYFAIVIVEARNAHGLIVPTERVQSFCTTHGRAYAAKFRLTIQNSPTGENKNATDDTAAKPDR